MILLWSVLLKIVHFTVLWLGTSPQGVYISMSS